MSRDRATAAAGAMTTADAGVTLRDVTLSYDRHPAVHHVEGRFAAGSMTAVVGPNGAGKSTLLKALAGRMRPDGGRIERGAGGLDRVAYLPQQSEIDRSFPISVLDCVLLGHWARAGMFRALSATETAAAHAALEAVGLSGFARRTLAELSVGQMQRVLFARLLLQDAALILLDEPFTAIDAKTTVDLIDLVRRWHGDGRTVIAVLHDLEQVRRHFPQTLLVAREPIAWGPTETVLSPENLLRARRLSEAWDERAPVCAR